MCRRIEAIEAQNRAADGLTEAIEAALYGAPTEPISKVIHVAFRDVPATPLDMAMKLGEMR